MATSPTGPAAEAMAKALASAQYFVFVAQVNFCANYAVVIWDWVTSLPREYRYVWKAQWTPVKGLYLFSRYWVLFLVPYTLWAFVTDHDLETCNRIFRSPVLLMMWNQLGGEAILLVRTYAFFNRSTSLLIALCAAFAGLATYQMYAAISQLELLPFLSPGATSGPCFPVAKPHSADIMGFFIAPLLFDTIVTGLTVMRALTLRRLSPGGAGQSRIVQIFVREGVFYYILISIANLVNGIMYLQPHQDASAINIPLSIMLGPILACRLVLDLRERGSNPPSSVTTSPTIGGSSPGGGGIISFGSVGIRNSNKKGTNNGSKSVVLTTLGPIPDDDVEMKGISPTSSETAGLGFNSLGRKTSDESALTLSMSKKGTWIDGEQSPISSYMDPRPAPPVQPQTNPDLGHRRGGSLERVTGGSARSRGPGVAGVQVNVEKRTDVL